MTETHDEASETFAVVTAELVCAYVSNNPVPVAELPALIARVHGAIAGLASGSLAQETGATAPAEIDRPSPAQIRKSVRPDGSSASSTARPTRRSSAT